MYEDEGRGASRWTPRTMEVHGADPFMRNIALTAPYMHDGSMTTLDEGDRPLHERRVGHPEPKSGRSAIHAFIAGTQRPARSSRGSLTDERPIDQVP